MADSPDDSLPPDSAVSELAALGYHLGHDAHSIEKGARTLVIEPAAASLRARAAWGRPVGPLTRGQRMSDHISLRAVGAPEGVIVTAACACGARREVLVDGRPFFTSADDAQAKQADRWAADRAVRWVDETWAGDHLGCALADPDERELGARFPSHAFALASSHVDRAVVSLRRGQGVPSYVGVIYRRDGEYGTSIAPLAGATEDPADSDSDVPSLPARQFGLREFGRALDVGVLGAFALGVVAYCEVIATGARSANPQLGLTTRIGHAVVFGYSTPDYGMLAALPLPESGPPRRGEPLQLMNLEGPLVEVLDGVLAQPLPAPRRS